MPVLQTKEVIQYYALTPIKLSQFFWGFFSLNKTSHKTQIVTRCFREDSWSVDGQDLIHPDLLICHPVDDAVISWVHVPQVVRNDNDSDGQTDHQPQHDVENHSIVEVVLVGQVVWTAWVTLQKQSQ